MSGPTATNFDVSPEGQRLRKYTSTSSTYSAPDLSGNLLAEKINGTWYDYVWLNGRMMEVIANGGVFSLHDDQTGRPQVMTEPNGTSIDWAAQNKAFDRTVTTNAWGPFNIGFPGQYYDSEDDLWYNGHRDYDAALGRYIESDPAGLLGGINTYTYVNEDPISGIDPLGLCRTCTELQQAAAQLASTLDTTSNEAGALSIASAVGGVISGAGELPSLGTDTPATVSLAAAAATFGDISVVTGGAGAALNSFALGNNEALAKFDFNRIEEIAVTAELSRIPGVGRFGDALGQLTGQAMDIASEGAAACEQP